ncbi:hypothetical protein FIU85_21855 (plasmid) [Roseovarius sp. THAF8]|uniref:helix-turn-helix domain-containing protein n=1 Tax=Roseovarius sp. THAF8 TaxID=2587846 RepID=UPI0012683EE0|nr:helix-turn-helix transcriptional regulator [Roseovarius sp. THAF8]QFT99981.1 hypothetical protein FIU85_21855 [Roseovarius sp. THAF8]
MPNSFRSELHELRPDVEEAAHKNRENRRIALALRSVRKDNGLTQHDLASSSDLTMDEIERIEAASGDLPKLEDVIRYMEACGGHLVLAVSGSEIYADAFPDARVALAV